MVLKIKVYKEKQYLVFDFENGKTVKYDFATKTAIGLKGKPVKDLKTQLRGITIGEIIESCEDEKYKEFLSFLCRRYNHYLCNVGTFLSKISENARFEQLFSAGLKSDQLYSSFKYSVNEIPKSLLKIAREREIHLSNSLVKYWKDNIDAHCLAYKIDFMSLNDNDLVHIFEDDRNFYDDYRTGDYQSIFNYLIQNYNYNAKSLLLYIDYLKTYEALDSMMDILDELLDYANMMNEISNKFDKYPRNFLTTHAIACRNYNRLKKQFEEDKFKNRINKDFECSFGKYVFLYPKNTQDIKDEATQQNNCVASYIDKVIDGNCHILFLRKKGFENESLVTIEVDPVQNKIVQAKGKFNRDVTEEENKAIESWNKKFSINKDMEVAA